MAPGSTPDEQNPRPRKKFLLGADASPADRARFVAAIKEESLRIRRLREEALETGLRQAQSASEEDRDAAKVEATAANTERNSP